MNNAEIFDEVAYCYDGTLEGLLCAIFVSYENKEIPSDIMLQGSLQPRLSQRIAMVETNATQARRVMRGITRACGKQTFDAVRKASLSSKSGAPYAIFRFVRYAMDEHRIRSCDTCKTSRNCASVNARYCAQLKGHALANIAHPDVSPLFDITRSIDNECEHVRQFARFKHFDDGHMGIWYAKCNPRDAVVPLVMSHFARRFGEERFALLDERHHMAGVYDGNRWCLADLSENASMSSAAASESPEEEVVQEAWRAFYRAISIESRYNPELRVKFMPKRFWADLTELAGEEEAPAKSRLGPVDSANA